MKPDIFQAVYTETVDPIGSPPDTLQYQIEEALRKVPHGMNRFSAFKLTCEFSHGVTPRWYASVSWQHDDEDHTVGKFGQTAEEAVGRISAALDGV